MISFLIPFSSDDHHRIDNFRFVYDQLSREWPEEEIVVEGGVLDRSAMRNRCAVRAKGDVLVFVDADSYVSPDQVGLAVQAVSQSQAGPGGLGWAFPYAFYCSLTYRATQIYRQSGSVMFDPGNPEETFQHVFPSIETPEPAVGGVVVVTKQAFEFVGGYDERFIGWGFEDRAFAQALTTMISIPWRVHGPLYHLWHPASEDQRFGQPNIRHNQELWNRYREAANSPEQMEQLISERL